MRTSETSRGRYCLVKYCEGMGLDLGYGGDPIVPSAITLDLDWKGKGPPILPHAPQNLVGDAKNLYWFKDGVFDYVYSSHLLEDFVYAEQIKVLEEWLRVIKVGGNLILYLPDEQIYRKHCKKKGRPRNADHKNDEFGLNSLLTRVICHIKNVEIVDSLEKCEDYSFYIVLRKVNNVQKS